MAGVPRRAAAAISRGDHEARPVAKNLLTMCAAAILFACAAPASFAAAPHVANSQQATSVQAAPHETGPAHTTNAQPPGFLALPPAGKGPGVLVLHAWWGLNGTIRDFCTRLAAAGFVVFAPDLYHGQVADDIAGAEVLVRALNAREVQVRAEIAEATRFLAERVYQPGGALAVVGFSLGAAYALDLSIADPEHVRSVVVFYGTGGDDFGRSKATYLGHFAANDPYEPKSSVARLEASLHRAGRAVTFYHYPGTGHWFFEPDRTQAYDRAAADLAWERTLRFLRDCAQQTEGISR